MQLAAATSPFPLLAAFGTITWGERQAAKTRVRGINLAAGTGAWAIGFQAWEGTRENPAATTKPWWAASSFGFAGREHELDSGLVYARDRYVASSQGRWTQGDRLGHAAGVNFYAYVANRPADLRDPRGQDWNPTQIAHASVSAAATLAVASVIAASVNTLGPFMLIADTLGAAAGAVVWLAITSILAPRNLLWASMIVGFTIPISFAIAIGGYQLAHYCHQRRR